MQSAPFNWNPADVRHLAKATIFAGLGHAEKSGLAFMVAIVAVTVAVGAGLAWSALVIAAAFALPFLIVKWQAREISRWTRYHGDCLITATWDDVGCRLSGCQHEEAPKIQWRTITLTIETNRYLILRSGRCMNFLPKHAFDALALQDVDRHLKANGVRQIRY